MLTNKHINILEKIGKKIHAQAMLSEAGVKSSIYELFTKEEYEQYEQILTHAHKIREKNRQVARDTMRERRKTDKYYGRPYSQKVKKLKKEGGDKHGI